MDLDVLLYFLTPVICVSAQPNFSSIKSSKQYHDAHGSSGFRGTVDLVVLGSIATTKPSVADLRSRKFYSPTDLLLFRLCDI
ncbi:hypothetical protein BJ138DRAFT_1150061, partial [Hygrophoropsis aurantiaca]